MSAGDELIHVGTNPGEWDDSALIAAYDFAMGKTMESIGTKSNSLAYNGYPKDRPNNAKKSSCKTKWKIGDYCQAVYSEDGLLYESLIKELKEEEGTCVVEFLGYANEETVNLSDLAPSMGKSTRTKQMEAAKKYIAQDWKAGDFCRALFSEDGYYYEGKVREVFQIRRTCLVRFIGYGNKEEISFGDMQPSGGKEYRLMQLRSAQTDDVTDEASSVSTSELSSLSSHEDNVDSIGNSRSRSPHIPNCQHYSDQNGPRPIMNEFLPENLLIPPLPMPFPSDPELSAENDHLATMLMSWYMAGYHTGYYQAKNGQVSPQSARATCSRAHENYSSQ